MNVYLLNIEADGGNGDYIGKNSIHTTKAGALAALKAFFYDHEDWFAEFGVTWEIFWDGATDLPEFAGNEFPIGVDCDGVMWSINQMEVQA